jgi:hypothetical protein
MEGMKMHVKDPAASAQKWSTRANGASNDYGTGVQNTQADQAGLAAAAAGVWAQAVAEAAATGRFAKNVIAAGTAKWKAGVKNLGVSRYGTGVQGATGKYTAGVGPYFTALANLNLPPRQTKGNNASRSNAVVQALMATKAGM